MTSGKYQRRTALYCPSRYALPIAVTLPMLALAACVYIRCQSQRTAPLDKRSFRQLGANVTRHIWNNAEPSMLRIVQSSLGTRYIPVASHEVPHVPGACAVSAENRFDCARDRALGREECEQRGCCYAPVMQTLPSGPPWCFYPPSYPGYRMGPFSPTALGSTATLSRSTPSYLPRDIAMLRLDVMEETESRLHLTVGISLVIYIC